MATGSPTATLGAPRRVHKRAGIYAFLAPALLALALVGVGAWNARDRSGNEATRLANRELSDALAKVPFPVRLPATLPKDAQLVRAFLDEPDYKQGFQVYQLNSWYRTTDRSGGTTIHIWQTNDNFLARELQDPTKRKGVAETLSGQPWNRVVDDRVKYHTVTTFSRRFDDGVTMSVSAPDPDNARATIKALRLVGADGRPIKPSSGVPLN